MEENAVSKPSGTSRGTRNWRSQRRSGRYNHSVHCVSEEHDSARLLLSSNMEESVVSQHISNISGRRNWQSRRRSGKFNRGKQRNSEHTYHASDSSMTAAAESFDTHDAVTAESHRSSMMNDHSAPRGTWSRNRGSRRPWQRRSSDRPDSVPTVCEPDCSSSELVEDDSSSSVASSTDTSESIEQITAGGPIVIHNSLKNARQHGHKRFLRGNRSRFRSPYPISHQNDAVTIETGETKYQVTGSTPVETNMHDQLELESNDEFVDDDIDVLSAGNVPVAGGGKQKNWNWNKRARGVRGSGRGHSRASRVHGVHDRKHTLISEATADTESAEFVPVEAVVRDGETKHGRSRGQATESGKYHTNSKQKASSTCQESEIANESVSTAGKSDNDTDVKQADVGSHGKNSASASKPSAHIDENLLFWHLVNEHNGKCCIDELKNQLNTSDADSAIGILRPLKRIKVLVNESDKWMSVAFVFLKGLRMCLNVRAGCKKEDCSFLHVCPDYVTESCHNGPHCRFGHDVRLHCNESCLQKSGISDSCSDESILTIARRSNPIVCSGYNGLGESECHSPGQCIQLHVCNYFFRGQCLVPDSKCILGHKLTSQHNAKLLTLYEVKHLLNGDEKLKTLHRMILTCNSSPAHTCIEDISKVLPDKLRISDFVAVVKPTLRTGLQFPKAEHDMKYAVMLPLILDDQLFKASASKPNVSHQAKQSVTLPRFVASHSLMRKTNSHPADTQLIELAGDEFSTSHLLSTEQPKTSKLTASMQSDDVKIIGVDANQLPSDMDESAETITTRQVDAVQRFATRRSQSTKTPEFRANQCLTYVKHPCNESSECSVRHDSLPYLWRIHDAGKWIAFDDNVSIEQAFCSPDNFTHTASYKVCVHLRNHRIIL